MKEGSVRLQNFLAHQGVASRRASADLVRTGHVTVNAKPTAEPGMRVCPGQDTIALDGKTIEPTSLRHRTIALHKPPGYVCSTRGQGSPTIYDLLPESSERLLPVGRLDKDSEGLLILTTDGALANRLMHPSFGHTKIYQVTVKGRVSRATLAQLTMPICIDGSETRPANVRCLASTRKGHTRLEFGLGEGRKRQIRELCARSGLTPHSLVRVQFGGLKLTGLSVGQWRELSDTDLRKLLADGPTPPRDRATS